MKNTIQQPLKRKWTGLIDNIRKFYSAQMGWFRIAIVSHSILVQKCTLIHDKSIRMLKHARSPHFVPQFEL